MKEKPSFRTRKAAPPQTENTPHDSILKYIASAIAILGIFAWISGHAFRIGYWGEAGFPDPPTSLSLQETAFFGFAAAIENWQWGVGTLIMTGLIFMLTSILIGYIQSKTNSYKTEDNKRLYIRPDREFITIGALLTATGSLLFSLVIINALWINGALRQGHKTFQKEICHVKSNQARLTKVELDDGKQLTGAILARTEKFLFILDKASIKTISINKKKILIDSTDLPKVSCK